MSARSRMTMRATIERNGAGANALGSPGPPDWATHATVACYAWLGTGRDNFGAPIPFVNRGARAIVPAGTDVTEADRIATIKDRRGTEIFGAMDIESVEIRSGHIELGLKEFA